MKYSYYDENNTLIEGVFSENDLKEICNDFGVSDIESVNVIFESMIRRNTLLEASNSKKNKESQKSSELDIKNDEDIKDPIIQNNTDEPNKDVPTEDSPKATLSDLDEPEDTPEEALPEKDTTHKTITTKSNTVKTKPTKVTKVPPQPPEIPSSNTLPPEEKIEEPRLVS